jgi:hypothetical protein
MDQPILPFFYRYPCPMRLPVTMLAYCIVAHLYDL